MKYVDPDGRESTLQINEDLLTVNADGNRPGVARLGTKSVVMHWTGVPGQTAQETRDFFGLESTETSAHYVIGQDGEIIRIIPDNEKAYHAGGTGNSLTKMAKENYVTSSGIVSPNQYTIGIEVNPEKKDGQYTKKAYTSSVQLAAKVLNDNGLDNVMGIFFGINLVRHGDITGKNCPKKFMNNDLSWFLFKVNVMTEIIKIKKEETDSAQ